MQQPFTNDATQPKEHVQARDYAQTEKTWQVGLSRLPYVLESSLEPEPLPDLLTSHLEAFRRRIEREIDERCCRLIERQLEPSNGQVGVSWSGAVEDDWLKRLIDQSLELEASKRRILDKWMKIIVDDL